MAGELKRAHRPADDAALRGRPPRTTQAPLPRPSTEALWFEAIEPGDPPRRRSASRFAAPLFVAALVVVAVVRSAVLRVLLPLALALAAVAMMMRGRAAGAAANAPRARRRGLALREDRLDFDDGAAQTLLYTDAPFGVTLLSTPRRDALVAVLSSSAGTFSIRAALGDAARDEPSALARMIDGASTAPDGLGLDAIGPDGAPLVIEGAAFVALVEALASRNPTCLSRFVLSDTRGAPVTLDDGILAAGERVVDLSAPLEWRSLLFQETFGQAIAAYQGTWVRQGATEFVLVSLLPALGAMVSREQDLSGLDRGALRDHRLMQAAFEQAPPSDQRVAIERLFMLPLRAALDEAPRASATQTHAQA